MWSTCYAASLAQRQRTGKTWALREYTASNASSFFRYSENCCLSSDPGLAYQVLSHQAISPVLKSVSAPAFVCYFITFHFWDRALLHYLSRPRDPLASASPKAGTTRLCNNGSFEFCWSSRCNRGGIIFPVSDLREMKGIPWRNSRWIYLHFSINTSKTEQHFSKLNVDPTWFTDPDLLRL